MSPEQRRWAINILQWPFIYGMALAGYRSFKVNNPDELAFESKAAAVYDWLNFWRGTRGAITATATAVCDMERSTPAIRTITPISAADWSATTRLRAARMC